MGSVLNAVWPVGVGTQKVSTGMRASRGTAPGCEVKKRVSQKDKLRGGGQEGIGREAQYS